MTLLPEQIQHMVATMTVGERKSWIQNEGFQAWVANGYRGTMEMATGTGKTRIGIRAAVEELKSNPAAIVYIIVPTETLRDTDWPNEMAEAGYPGLEKQVRMVCWKSLGKEKSIGEVDLLILDEVHHMTIVSSAFMQNNKVYKIMGLTATLPEDTYDEDKTKLTIIHHYCPPIFEVTLEQAIGLKIVTDFEMFVLKFDLDDTDYYLDGGTKAKPYKTTEVKKYAALTKLMQRAAWTKNPGLKFVAIQKRTEFLYNLRTKEQLARDVIKAVMTKGERTIMFCGSIDQSVRLCGDNVYNSETSTKALDAFKDKEIDYLGVVQALNEGKNLPDIDQLLIIQLTSKELNLIQRIGRAIRWRENHLPRIIVLVAKGTADEKWYKAATKNMSKSRIKEHYVKPEAQRT